MDTKTMMQICVFLQYLTAAVVGALVGAATVRLGSSSLLLIVPICLLSLLGGAVCVMKSVIRVYGNAEWLATLK